MKLVCTSVQPDQVARVVDMLRTLGYTQVAVEADESGHPSSGHPSSGHPSMRVEVLVKEVDAPGAAVALSRATSQDPHPVLVTDVSPLEFVGEPSGG